MRRSYIITRLIDFLIGLVILILGLRVLFRLFDANATGFVQWIYDTSDVIMAPFRGIFPPATIDRGNILDISALFAILVYAVIGLLLTWLVSALTADDDAVVYEEDTRPKRKTVRKR